MTLLQCEENRCNGCAWISHLITNEIKISGHFFAFICLGMFKLVLTGINMYMYLFVVASWTVSFLLTMRGSRGVSKVCICAMSPEVRLEVPRMK